MESSDSRCDTRWAKGLRLTREKPCACLRLRLTRVMPTRNTISASCTNWDKAPSQICPSAAHYYQLAAEQGVVKAQYRMGVLLAKGVGVQTDRVSAYKWLMLAQDSVPSATKALNDLRPSMPAGEISEAEQQVDAWRIAHKQAAH